MSATQSQSSIVATELPSPTNTTGENIACFSTRLLISLNTRIAILIILSGTVLILLARRRSNKNRKLRWSVSEFLPLNRATLANPTGDYPKCAPPVSSQTDIASHSATRLFYNRYYIEVPSVLVPGT
jgi:hypothetical protein